MRTLIALAIPAMNFVLLVAVGLELTRQDFVRVRARRAVLVTGLIAPVVLLPPLALALVGLFQPKPDITASLLLVAACPIGGISNTYSYLAQASTALSVTLTALSCLAATVTIPLIGKGFELALERSLGLSAPILLLTGQLLFVLALPVAIGMWARQRAPAVADRYSPALRRVAFAGTAFALLLIVADQPGAFVMGFLTAAPLAGTFVVASIAAGWLAAALVTADAKDRFTLAAEFGTRNVGVALAIAVALLGRVEFARFAVVYAVCEIPLMLLAVAWFRRRQALVGSYRATWSA